MFKSRLQLRLQNSENEIGLLPNSVLVQRLRLGKPSLKACFMRRIFQDLLHEFQNLIICFQKTNEKAFKKKFRTLNIIIERHNDVLRLWSLQTTSSNLRMVAFQLAQVSTIQLIYLKQEARGVG